MSKHRLESLTRSSYNVCCHSRPRVTLPQNGSVSGDPSDQGIQDILKLCHLNVISMHRMLLLKTILLYKKGLHYAVYGHMLHISLHAICTMYINVLFPFLDIITCMYIYTYIYMYIYKLYIYIFGPWTWGIVCTNRTEQRLKLLKIVHCKQRRISKVVFFPLVRT